MSDQTPRRLSENFFRACVLLLGGITALYLAVSLLAAIWGWLLLVALLATLITAAVIAYRRWRDRHF